MLARLKPHTLLQEIRPVDGRRTSIDSGRPTRVPAFRDDEQTRIGNLSCDGRLVGGRVINASNDISTLNLLKPLADHNVVMTFIESRPSRRKNWDYVFFIDIDGHADESPVSDALAILEKESSLFRVLGAYPKAVS